MDDLIGKCHCGENIFSISDKPEFQFICYCNNCRSLNSAGHLCGIIFDKSTFSESIKTKIYTYQGGSGHTIIMHFCPTCATHLYAYPLEYKDKVVIRANTLTNFEFKPQQVIFSESAFSWDMPFSVYA